MNIDLSKMPTFGVAGNFAGHLEQAGEAVDFANMKTAEANAPKAIFPTYMPCKKNSVVPEFLLTYPFDSEKIIFPENETNLQIESECAVICNLKWNNSYIEEIEPILFGASNDCSIRKEGAKKISLKKNWGTSSKGLSSNLIPIDSFTSGGILSRYRIACYLIRDGKVIEYGENSGVSTYSYIYEKLTEWMKDKLNSQKCEGPAEDIHSYLLQCGCPSQVMISIGATRYTDFGEHNYLKRGDKTCVLLYPDSISAESLKSMVESNSLNDDRISVLMQEIM